MNSNGNRKKPAIAFDVLPIIKRHGIDMSEADDMEQLIEIGLHVMESRAKSQKIDRRQLEELREEWRLASGGPSTTSDWDEPVTADAE